jgi:hypothetical protein
MGAKMSAGLNLHEAAVGTFLITVFFSLCLQFKVLLAYLEVE